MARGGLASYLKTAFLQRWNLLLLIGAASAAAISPWPDALLPLVAAGELSYLVGLVSRSRFRKAVDASRRKALRASEKAEEGSVEPTVRDLVAGLSRPARERFTRLRARCLEMQHLAQRAQGKMAQQSTPAQALNEPALDRLLWTFLRLLLARQALDRFMESTDESDLEQRLKDVRTRYTAAQAEEDERLKSSLHDSVAVSELRLDNYRKAAANAEFMGIELDRIESKIQALVEMSVIRQDPDFLTSQVDAAAESMHQSETAIRELQSITGLTTALEKPPPILTAELGDAVGSEA